MLDEKLEYSLYLTPGYGGIIYNKNLKDGFTGIRLILVILARGFLEDCREEKIEDIEQQHRYAIAFLKLWLMGDKITDLNRCPQDDIAAMAKYPILQSRCEAAKNACLLSYLKEKGIKNESTLEWKINNIWDTPVFAHKNGKKDKDDKGQGVSNLNAIYFSCIIADAIEQGPLRRSVLRVHNSEDWGFEVSGIYTRRLIDREDRVRTLMAIVATYLQNKSRDCKSTIVTLAGLSNYLGKNCDSVSKFIAHLGLEFRGSPLFVKQEIAGAVMKLTVNEEWLKRFSIHLDSADQLKKSGYVTYDDNNLCGALIKKQ